MKKDVDLKKMSRAELEQKYIELATKNEALSQENQWYREQINLQKKKLFGRSSEKENINQRTGVTGHSIWFLRFRQRKWIYRPCASLYLWLGCIRRLFAFPIYQPYFNACRQATSGWLVQRTSGTKRIDRTTPGGYPGIINRSGIPATNPSVRITL